MTKALYEQLPTTDFNQSGGFETITEELTPIVKSPAALVMAAGIGVLAASVAGNAWSAPARLPSSKPSA